MNLYKKKEKNLKSVQKTGKNGKKCAKKRANF